MAGPAPALPRRRAGRRGPGRPRAGRPAARLATDERTGQLLLWTHGPAHAELLLDGLPAAPVRVPPGTRPVALRVRVPAWAERPVRSDLTARGAEVVAVEADGGAVLLEVRLPPAEAAGYALALGRASAHTGTLAREPWSGSDR